MNQAWRKRNAAKVRLAAKRSILIRNAIKDSIDVDKVIEDWLSTHNTAEITTSEARLWAQTHIRPDDSKLNIALKDIYAEAYVFGQDVAMSAISKAKINKAPRLNQMRRAVGIDWDNWKAGDRRAAALLKPPKGLSTLLDSRSVTLVSIRGTTVDRIGTLLAYALQRGLPPKSIAPLVEAELAPLRKKIAKELKASIDKMMSDSDRALTIAQTEMSRAVSVASRELYEESGVELVEWLIADPCDECQENADASPIGIDEEFPSGDTEPPAHPNCVCDIAPYVVDTRNIGETALSLILED